MRPCYNRQGSFGRCSKERDVNDPNYIHHKTGAIIVYPLEADGVKFYADAEEALAKLPAGYQWSFASLKTGAKPFAFSTMQHIVQRAWAKPPAR
jgi:hypothetical protein